MKNVLITAPVRQSQPVLRNYLRSLENLNYPKSSIQIFWVLNNSTDLTKEILLGWSMLHKEEYKKIDIKIVPDADEFLSYRKNHWTNGQLGDLCNIRNLCLSKILETDCEFAFTFDSDITIHPETINNLIKQDKDIIAELMTYEGNERVNVWAHNMRMYDICPSFWEKLKPNKVYEVGGVSQVVMYSREIIKKGLSYSEPKDYAGEWGHDDIFLSLNAKRMGVTMFVDTSSPAKHLPTEIIYPNGENDEQAESKCANDSIQ